MGSRVARRLADRGEELRLVVRDPSRAPELPGAEVRQASSYGDGEAMRAALEGAETVFIDPGGRVGRPAIDAARDRGRTRPRPLRA